VYCWCYPFSKLLANVRRGFGGNLLRVISACVMLMNSFIRKAHVVTEFAGLNEAEYGPEVRVGSQMRQRRWYEYRI
jgi:hypothetical protein